MKASPQMGRLCEEIRAEKLDDPKALPQRLLKLLDAGFIEQDDCVFLSTLKKSLPVKRADFANRTAYECFVNHIHVEKYLENGGLPPLQMLGRGMALAHEVRERLVRLYGAKNFRVIVAFDGEDCTVRFHTIRINEEWVDKDSGASGYGAVAVFETRELKP